MYQHDEKRSDRHGLRIGWLIFAALLVALLVGMLGSAFPGTAEAQKKRIVVPRDFSTIQEAVDAAPRGSTINVLEGTYEEELVLDKDLTLKGEGADGTIIKAPPTLTPFARDTRNENPVVAGVQVTNGASVAVSGFTMEGPTPCNVTAAGMRVVKAATLELTNSSVTRMQPEDCPPGTSIGQGVVIGLPPFFEIEGQRGSLGHGTVTNVRIDRYKDTGITVAGPPGGSPSTATISHNVVTGGTQIPVAQVGIQLAPAAKVQVTDNTIRGNVCTLPSPRCGPDPVNQEQSKGILALNFPTGQNVAELSNNRVSDNDVGIYQLAAPNCCTISENTLQKNRFFGIVIRDGDGATQENTISGGEVGIGVVAVVRNTVGVLRGDKITRTSEDTIREIDAGADATASVEEA